MLCCILLERSVSQDFFEIFERIIGSVLEGGWNDEANIESPAAPPFQSLIF